MVLFSPSLFHTENLGPKLLRLSPDQSPEQNARALRERPCNNRSFPHTQEVAERYSIGVMHPVLFRAIRGTIVLSRGVLPRIAAEDSAYVLHSRVAERPGTLLVRCGEE